MPGSFPQYSNIYPQLAKLLRQRGGNTRPMQQGGVSGLSTWFRLISSVTAGKNSSGLVLETIGAKSTTFETNYGNNSKSGIIGYSLAGIPIQVSGRGLRPSPIVTSVNVDEKAEGGSRITTIKIVAFTSEQADALAAYFLEPGFHLLCEWGWNTQSSVSQKCSAGKKQIVPCDIVKYDTWNTIKEKREKSGYTYDAVLGIVVGGGMSFGDNETYELEIKVTGVGNVAEYMQTHRDANKLDTPKKDSSITFSSQDIDSALGAKNLGRALFMQMFNELPGQKRTKLVQKLVDTPIWADEANFVNMDKVVKETLSDSMSEGAELKSADATKDAKIPKDIPLISTDRYIRFELACEIINSYPINLKPQSTNCGKDTRDQRIKIENTFCTAFPHMFSTDKSKLFIPNTTAPNFNLLNALSSTSEVKDFITFDDLNSDANLANLHPLGGANTPTNENGNAPDFLNGKAVQNRPVPYAFPARYKLRLQNSADPSFKEIREDAGFWGHLKNLYINFDFFVECISKPNFVVRDVFYEMLNGMSSACNSMWRFQIMETINPTSGDLELSVVDLNFSGQVEIEDVVTLQARGTTSPFVSCDFNLEVPGAMVSSQVQKKLNSSVEHSPELNPRPMRGNVFSNNVDEVGTILQGLKVTNAEEEVTKDNNAPATPSKKSANELEEEARALNYEYYTKTGAVLPRIQDRNGKLDITKTFFDMKGNDATIEELLMVGVWNDTSALRQVFLIDKGIAKGGKSTSANQTTINKTQNPPFGLASFNFRVHGVSGFKVGDKFRIEGLPKKFGKPSFFQIVKVDHSIEDMSWWTDIKGELRVVGG